MDDGAFTIPVGEVHFEITLQTLAQGTVELQILVKSGNDGGNTEKKALKVKMLKDSMHIHIAHF